MTQCNKTLKALFALLLAMSAHAEVEVLNREALRGSLGISDKPSEALKAVKVAILANGFGDFQPSDDDLPATAVLVQGPQKTLNGDPHGLQMAQIVWWLTGGNKELAPAFHLVNADGYENFEAAIAYVIEKDIDVVIHAQVWPFGSNGDGEGFLNKQVNRAIDEGVIWVNASGNLQNLSYRGKVNQHLEANNSILQFGKVGERTGYLPFENKFDKNRVRITLNWTDFFEHTDIRGDKDLDLIVENELGQEIKASRKKQDGATSYAFEVVELNKLPRGNYWIRVQDKSKNFSDKDEFGLYLRSDKAIAFPRASEQGVIQAPSDNPRVITVGEAQTGFSSTGKTRDGRLKPDVLVPDSHVQFSDAAEATAGSSNASAMVAAAIVMMKAKDPTLYSDRILKQIRSMPANTLGRPVWRTP